MLKKLSKDELLNRYAAGERNFIESDLTGLDLSRVDLPGINLTRSVLSRADLTEANLSNSILVSANLSSTILNRANFTRANLVRANLSRSLLNKAILQEALLLQADLSGAIMIQANLYKTRLRQANLKNTNLRSANLEKANLTHIQYNYETLFPEGFDAVKAAGIYMSDYPIAFNASDADGWNLFWKYIISNNQFYYNDFFCSMFSDYHKLVPLFKKHGYKTILCAGNGISLEPYFFANEEFSVTALDISSEANKFLANFPLNPSDLRGFYQENYPGNKEPAGNFYQEEISKIKSVKLVTGDIFNSDCCPGPFDVIITRKTLQCFWGKSGEKTFEGMQALLARLSPHGLLYVHTHNTDPWNDAMIEWVQSQGILDYSDYNADIGEKADQRLFYFWSTSG